MKNKFKVGDWIDLDFSDDLPVARGYIHAIAKGWQGVGLIYQLYDDNDTDLGWFVDTRFLFSANPPID